MSPVIVGISVRAAYVAAVVLAATVAASPAPASASDFGFPIECGGDALVPPVASCHRDFGFEPGSLTVKLVLEPSTGFTGTLRAAVSGTGGGTGVGGFYLNGTLVPGSGTSSITFILPAGIYKLAVDAGKPLKLCPAGCAEIPAFAVGRFNAALLIVSGP